MQARDMITIRNKKTGEVKNIPKDQYKTAETGLAGIGNDLVDSLESAIPAFGQMISDIPGGLKKAGRYALSNNPVETLGNLGAGGVEGVAQLLSSPQILSRYLGEKFPGSKEESNKPEDHSLYQLLMKDNKAKAPTPYEALMNFEKEHGLASRGEDESSVRNIGNLIFGGKGLTTLPNAASRVGAITAQQAGAGGDPVHAAILGILGEKAAQLSSKGINKAAGMSEPEAGIMSPELSANMAPAPSSPNGYTTISNIPKAVFNVAKATPEAATNFVKNIPEMAGTAASTGLDTLAAATHKVPIIPSLTEALSDYIKYKSIKPETHAQRKLFADIESKHLPEIQERQEASKRLGLSYLTPAESTLSPFEAAKQGTIGRTAAGSKLLYEKGRGRSESEEQALNTLQRNIYDPETLAPEKKAAYEEAMSASVPEDFIQKWKQDPVVEHAIKQFDSEPTYKRAVRGIPKNSFEYWNIVKRVIGDMEKEHAKGMKKFSSDQATNARNQMVDEMDQIQPEYKIARKIAEREFTRKDIEDFFDKRNMTGNEFSKFMKSKKDFDRLLDKLEPYPEAQQNLKDMKLLFGDLIPSDPSIRTAAALEKTSMSSARNKVDALKRSLDQKYGQAHDVALVNLMTDPEWVKLLERNLKKKGK